VGEHGRRARNLRFIPNSCLGLDARIRKAGTRWRGPR
jgi:hypothetical protein